MNRPWESRTRDFAASESRAQYRLLRLCSECWSEDDPRRDHGRERARDRSGTLSGFDGQWKRHETVIRPSATSQHAQFNLFFDDKESIDLDMVSLFPVDTWNNRPNGLRKDLVQLLQDMHPRFLRFPGRCIVEGRRLETRYRWKTTVGDIAQRKTIINAGTRVR